jgi:hypothetical protein
VTDLVRFRDGAVLSYDPQAHVLAFALPDGGKLALTGDLAVSGTITAHGDVTGAGISLATHRHGGVQGGSGQSGGPCDHATGMSRTTGAALGDEHLAQSCEDIVTTPLGTRVMRRDYGCLLAELIDRPLNRATFCSPRWPLPSRSPGGSRASRCGR